MTIFETEHNDGDDAQQPQPLALPALHQSLQQQSLFPSSSLTTNLRLEGEETTLFCREPLLPELPREPSSVAETDPNVASGKGEAPSDTHDLTAKESDEISIAHGRTQTSDEIYANAIATEAALLSGKSGFATDSLTRAKHRVPRITVPGVEYIRRRVLGVQPSWYRERISRSRHLADSEQQSELPLTSGVSSHDHGNNVAPPVSTQNSLPVADANRSILKRDSEKRRRRRQIIWAMITCVIIGVALGVGLGVTKGRSGSSSSSAASTFAPYSQDCNTLHSTANPNVLTQCQCTHTISIVPNQVAARYTVLVQVFMPLDDPNFDENIHSCSPENQALVWLASVDGGSGTTSSDTLMQRYRLALLFILWNGPLWAGADGWLSSESECSWFGIICNSQNQVTAIMLNNQNITGEIALDAALNLTSLIKLDLSENGIQGSLSEALGSHNLSTSSLASLDPSSNQLNGTLPPRLGMLTILHKLQLALNNIRGPIPTEFGLLHKLTAIDLSTNNLTGQIPTHVRLWANAEIILLFSNNFTTTLPTELGSIPNLLALEISSGGVFGSLPMELFHINSTLTTLDVDSNFLTGTIPSEVGNSYKLSTFVDCFFVPVRCVRMRCVFTQFVVFSDRTLCSSVQRHGMEGQIK
jgi:hypothetical protein